VHLDAILSTGVVWDADIVEVVWWDGMQACEVSIRVAAMGERRDGPGLGMAATGGEQRRGLDLETRARQLPNKK
jgi:hypothetical protein